MTYNMFERSAISAVRDLKEYSLVDPKYLDSNKEPISAPSLNLCSKIPLKSNSLQQSIEEDTFRQYEGSSLSGGSHIRVDYSSSYDAYITRGKVKEINVA